MGSTDHLDSESDKTGLENKNTVAAVTPTL